MCIKKIKAENYQVLYFVSYSSAYILLFCFLFSFFSFHYSSNALSKIRCYCCCWKLWGDCTEKIKYIYLIEPNKRTNKKKVYTKQERKDKTQVNVFSHQDTRVLRRSFFPLNSFCYVIFCFTFFYLLCSQYT